MPSPVDGSVWGSYRANPGAVVRLDPGANPPETALTEIYNVPAPGFGVRGADIDKKGVVWVSLASGHLGSFDRSKCKGPLNGPKATGDHCPEGWAFHQYPGPGFEGIGENSAESSYYTWVDQHNTFGLGADVPMSTGNLNDGLIALKDGKMVVLRVPYPLGFYAKGFDGRIEPKAGEGRPVMVKADRRPARGGGAAARPSPAPGRPIRREEKDEGPRKGREGREKNGIREGTLLPPSVEKKAPRGAPGASLGLRLHLVILGPRSGPEDLRTRMAPHGARGPRAPRSLSSGRQTPDPDGSARG